MLLKPLVRFSLKCYWKYVMLSSAAGEAEKFGVFYMSCPLVKKEKEKGAYESPLSSQFTVSTILVILEQENDTIEALFLDS